MREKDNHSAGTDKKCQYKQTVIIAEVIIGEFTR